MKKGSFLRRCIGKYFFVSFIILVFSIHDVFSYEPSLINIKIPSLIEPWAMEVSMQHRFSRIIGKKPLYSFFDDANVQLSIIGHLWKGVKAELKYGVIGSDLELGLQYSYPLISRWLVCGGYVSVFAFDHTPSRVRNMFFSALVQTELVSSRWYLFTSLQYEGFHKYGSVSFGSLLKVVEFLDFIIEYTPFHDEPNKLDKTVEHTFALGIKFNTYSHHFKIILSNATGIGPRRASRGAESNDMRFGFSIQKLFTF